MQFTHGGFGIDLSEEWEDHSTLFFVRRRQESIPALAQVNAEAEAISIKFVRLDENEPRDPRAFLGLQCELHAEADPGYELLSDGPFECALGPGWCCEERLTTEAGQSCQLLVAVRTNGPIIVVTAACSAHRFEKQRDVLREILESMHPARVG